MNYFKKVLYLTITFIGIVSVFAGLFPIYIETLLLSKNLILINNNWIIIIGFIFTFIGLLLLVLRDSYPHKNSYFQYSTTELFLLVVLIFSLVFFVGWLYGQYENTRIVATENMENMREQLLMLESMEKDNPFHTKKVIIRDDDVGNLSYIQGVMWLSELCNEKGIKVTYAVIPMELASSPETIAYLNTLDKNRFEFAVHGYEHTLFKGLPYSEQYEQIDNSTKIIKDKLHYKPFTFVPPNGSGDINTTKACKFLGYHSITDVIGYPSYLADFTSDFEWEKSYNPVSHHKFQDFKTSFDKFYNSSDEYYIVYLHDWTFLDEQLRLQNEKTEEFEKAIDYMEKDNVQFFTIEEAYRWNVDEPNIKTFKTGTHDYLIDLTECQYDHAIKFHSPLNMPKSIILTDMTTNNKTVFNNDSFEFNGLKKHWYTISTS